MLPAPASTAAAPKAISSVSWSPAVPPPPVFGAPGGSCLACAPGDDPDPPGEDPEPPGDDPDPPCAPGDPDGDPDPPGDVGEACDGLAGLRALAVPLAGVGDGDGPGEAEQAETAAAAKMAVAPQPMTVNIAPSHGRRTRNDLIIGIIRLRE